MILARTTTHDVAPADAVFAVGIGAAACNLGPVDLACPNFRQANYRPEVGSEVPW
jgi:hypothetical protein